MFQKHQITGTLVNYYTTCKREAWLYARHIYADQNDENMLMGRALADTKEKSLHEFSYSNLKFDKISKENGHYLITEYKKSLKNQDAVKMQLLFYMYILKTNLGLKKITGKVISGKKVIFIDDNDKEFLYMDELLDEITSFINEQIPPKFSQNKFCKNCAYLNYCN